MYIFELIQKRNLMKFIILIFWIFYASVGFANEVGNQLFVAEPQAAPVYVSKSGTRYWPCNGFVGQNMINVTYDEIVQISKGEGINIPQKNLCYWKRGVFNFGGNSI